MHWVWRVVITALHFELPKWYFSYFLFCMIKCQLHLEHREQAYLVLCGLAGKLSFYLLVSTRLLFLQPPLSWVIQGPIPCSCLGILVTWDHWATAGF